MKVRTGKQRTCMSRRRRYVPIHTPPARRGWWDTTIQVNIKFCRSGKTEDLWETHTLWWIPRDIQVATSTYFRDAEYASFQHSGQHQRRVDPYSWRLKRDSVRSSRRSTSQWSRWFFRHLQNLIHSTGSTSSGWCATRVSAICPIRSSRRLSARP